MQLGESSGVAKSYKKMVIGGSTEEGDEDKMSEDEEEDMGRTFLIWKT